MCWCLQRNSGPRTGTEDADRDHRWAVRLTDVRLTQDPSGGLFLPVPSNVPLEITEIRWAEQDALPFRCACRRSPIRIMVRWDRNEVSAAYGNIVLADHGRTVHNGRWVKFRFHISRWRSRRTNYVVNARR